MRRSFSIGFAASLLTACLFASSSMAANGPMMTGASYQGGATGISAHGNLTAATGELTAAHAFTAKVTCLEVNGYDGIATAVIRSSQNSSYPVGETVVAEGYDTDASAPSQLVPGTPTDLWRISFDSNGGIYPDYFNPGCYLPFFPPVSIQHGDILVSPS